MYGGYCGVFTFLFFCRRDGDQWGKGGETRHTSLNSLDSLDPQQMPQRATASDVPRQSQVERVTPRPKHFLGFPRLVRDACLGRKISPMKDVLKPTFF